MFDIPISKMNDKQLRNAVQLLYDELAIMKRKYEDIIYNLDTDNFSQRIVKQGKDMYTKIEQTAEEITLQAEKVEENSSNIGKLTVSAEKIESEVFEKQEDGTKISRITQNADSITSEVEARESADTQLSTKITQTASEIRSEVNDISEGLSTEITQTARQITSRVGNLESGKYGDYTLFTQDNNTFLFDGQYMNISAAIILTDNDGNRAFSIFHNKGSGDTVPGVYMWGTGNYKYTPLIIGEKSTTGTQGVYLYQIGDDNHIATRGWVRANGGGSSTAVFA